jgi:hypothetical protein
MERPSTARIVIREMSEKSRRTMSLPRIRGLTNMGLYSAQPASSMRSESPRAMFAATGGRNGS